MDTAHNYVTDGLGAYAGLLNGTIQVLDANSTGSGALYLQTAGASWEPGPGPLLYVEVTGDFVATVKVVDFAGTLETPMLHNDAGNQAPLVVSRPDLPETLQIGLFYATYTATDGTWTAFLMGADPSVWQLTDYVIGAEDVFELQVDARNTWQGTTLRIILFYDEEGIRFPVAFADVAVADEMQTFSLVFDARETPDAVGKRIGVEFDNVTANGESWIGLDNVCLTDLEGR